MSVTPLRGLWEASAGQPFYPTVGKGSQFAVGFILLLTAFILTSLFGLSMCSVIQELRSELSILNDTVDNSFKNIPVYGIPASLAFG